MFAIYFGLSSHNAWRNGRLDDEWDYAKMSGANA